MLKTSSRWLSPVLLLVFASACTATGKQEEQAGEKPPVDTAAPEQPEQPPIAATTKISVASVQMIQDCPDPEPEPEEAPAAAERSVPAPSYAPAQRRAPGDEGPGGRGFRQPCDQSTVQLALETDNEAPVAIEIRAVRILSKGKSVGELKTRKPTIWTDSSYQPWDQTVAPGAPTKASYKLSMPNWSEVEKAIGESSYGHMFTLELDVAVDGEIRTVSSPEFPREEPHVIVT